MRNGRCFVFYNALGGRIWVGAWSTGVYVFGQQITVRLLRLHAAELWLAGVLARTLLTAGAYWGIANRSRSRR